MEVFQKLKVFVSKDVTSIFEDKLIEKASEENWKQKLEFERDYRINVMTDDIVICIESPKLCFQNNDLQAYVWLWYKKECFEVFNIIPSLTRSLSYEQYNFILDRFYKVILKEVAKEMELDIIITSPNKMMSEIIGDEAYDILYKFSRSANKSTGNTNPFDFDRWCDFVFVIFRNEINLNIDDFVRWLEEDENWPNDVAFKLGLDLEYALDILKKYEQSN